MAIEQNQFFRQKDKSHRRPRFERQLYWALFLLLIGLAVFAIGSYRAVVSINSERSFLTERYSQAFGLVGDLRYLQVQEDRLVYRLVLSGDPALYTKIKSTRADFKKFATRVEEVDRTPFTALRLEEISELRTQLVQRTDAALASRAKGVSRESVDQAITKLGGSLNQKITGVIDELYFHERDEFMHARARTYNSTHAAIQGFVFAALVTGIAFLLVVLLIVRLIQFKQERDHQREFLYEATKRSAQARKEALETVSHDLKNPLSAVELSLQLLQMQNGARGPIATALRAVQSMKDLIQLLLDQAKMEAGTYEPDLKPFDIHEIIVHAKDILEPLARQKGIQVEIFSSEGQIPALSLDRQRMSQVVSNILGNAIKFTPRGGKITIQIIALDQDVEVRISDTGPGIPEDQINQVFERFWQPKSTRKQGTGLGLAIAKGVVEAHGGRIWAESSPGQGATFCFMIPMRQVAKEQNHDNAA